MNNKLKVKGKYYLEHWRSGKLLHKEEITNLIVTSGLNYINDVAFHAASQITTWYMGLINNSGFTAIAAADTPASHAGWSELTSYDETTRPAWTEGASSGGIIESSALTVFTISATVTVNGIFLVSVNTKGSTSGTLLSAASFTSPRDFVDDDVVKISYGVELSP